MSSKLRVLVVEDEAPARRKLARLLAAHADLERVGEAGDGGAALAAIAELAPDVVLLDVSIPAPDGLQVAAAIAAQAPPRPEIIFLTAHDEHALRAFELRAADYLLKPLSAERLAEALQRIRARRPPDPPPQRLLVDTGERQVPVGWHEITRLQAAGNYVEVHAGGRLLLTRATLEAIEAELLAGAFVRVNRSTVVAVSAIAEMQRRPHGEIMLRLHDGSKALWTRRYRRQGPPVPALGQLIPKR